MCTGALSFLDCKAQSARPEIMNGKAGMDLNAIRLGDADVQASKDTAPIKNVETPLIRLMSCILRVNVDSEASVISEKPSGTGDKPCISYTSLIARLFTERGLTTLGSRNRSDSEANAWQRFLLWKTIRRF